MLEVIRLLQGNLRLKEFGLPQRKMHLIRLEPWTKETKYKTEMSLSTWLKCSNKLSAITGTLKIKDNSFQIQDLKKI